MVNWSLTFCNTTLDELNTDNEVKAYGSLTFHQMGLIICAGTGLFATLLSFYLMFMHATHYSKPWEQRHILRILFMIPIYSVVSFLSFYFYHHYVYYEVIRDCYDAFAIASFFSLLCHYLAQDLHDQKEYFRTLTPKNWLMPVNWFQKCCGTGQTAGPWRVPRSGLTWFNIMWVFIFQYCLLRVLLTIVAVITQHYGRYCVEGLSPAYFHVWFQVLSAISVTFAMYCLIQFYYQIRQDISQHSPLLKIISIKLVIFFVFWQTIVLGFLNSSGVIKPSEKIALPDIIIGIPAMLIDIEMAGFAILHIFAYPWKPYDHKRTDLTEAGTGTAIDETDYKGGRFGFKAYLDAFNPWDIIKAIGRAFKWAFVGRRSRENDKSYQKAHAPDLQEDIPMKSGKYEQLDDDHGAEDEHYTYDPHTGKPGSSSHSGRHDERTVMPGRIAENDGFAPVPSHPHNADAEYPAFSQDTSYHAPSHDPARTMHMPEESQYYAGHGR